MPKLALCMVCTDEEATIGRALDSVLPAIDGWVVSYNGQRDATAELIRQRLGHLPGELRRSPWVSYGHNRTEALRMGRELGHQYLLVVDADEVLEDVAGLRGNLVADGYEITERMGTMEQQKLRVFRADRDWHYVGGVHEYADCPQPKVTGRLPAAVRNLRDGAGSQLQPRERYLQEAAMLRHDLQQDPLNSRAQFYLAQSLELAGDVDDAIAAYEQRALMVGWAEETFYALLRIAQARASRPQDAPLVPWAYLRAWQYRPSRAEPLVELAAWFRQQGHHHAALVFAEQAAQIPMPADRLFLMRDHYDWRAHDERALALHGVGRYADALRAVADLMPRLPREQVDRVTLNAGFSLAGLAPK